jgi:hypothetical protein
MTTHLSPLVYTRGDRVIPMARADCLSEARETMPAWLRK